MRLIAHRGYSAVAPENTLSAFKKAKEAGFDYVECDVRFTKDNQAIIIHDEDLKRTSSSNGIVKNKEYEELKSLDFGSWFSGDFKDEPVLLFKDFIEYCALESLYPYIELKDERIPKESLLDLLEIVEDFQMLDQVTWISFDIYNLLELSSLREELRLGILGKANLKIFFYRILLNHSKHEVFFNLSRRSTDSLFFKFLVKYYHVEVWTIDAIKDYKKLSRLGVEGITTNAITKEHVF